LILFLLLLCIFSLVGGRGRSPFGCDQPVLSFPKWRLFDVTFSRHFLLFKPSLPSLSYSSDGCWVIVLMLRFFYCALLRCSSPLYLSLFFFFSFSTRRRELRFPCISPTLSSSALFSSALFFVLADSRLNFALIEPWRFFLHEQTLAFARSCFFFPFWFSAYFSGN